MNELIPVPPSGQGLQLMEPMGGGHAAPSSKFRLHKFLQCLRRFWWIPAITMVLASTVAVIIFYKTPPIFVSYGTMTETEKLRLPEGAAFTEDRENYLGTISEMLGDTMMRNKTLAEMQAADSNSIVYGGDGKPIPVRVQFIPSPKSSVYAVVARSANPAFTQAYLHTLMNAYLEFRQTSRQTISSTTGNSIAEQVEKQERALQAAQTALVDYERTNNFAVLQQENSVEAIYLEKLKTELSDYQLQIKLLDTTALEKDSTQPGGTNAADSLFATLGGSASAASSTGGRDDAARQIELLKLDRARLSKYLRPEHPKIVKLDEEIARSQKLIDVYHQQSQEQLATARQALQIKIDDTEAFIRQWEVKLADSNNRIAEADGYRQTIGRTQAMYDRLVSLQQNLDISEHIDQDTLAVLDDAQPATRSYKEGVSMVGGVTFFGLAIGFGIIFLMSSRDDRFMSLVEVTDRFGDNVVGQVPEIRERAGAAPLALLGSDDARHGYAESYRNLRSALLFLAVDGQRPKMLLITSAVPNEGKSTVATNLARAMAMGGSRVLLVDGDLRKGHIHEGLGLPSKPGLSDLLCHPEDPASFIQPTDLPNFMFLARGNAVRNPGDLFLSPVFDQLLARLRGEYDYVLIDSSPVFASDDATTMAPKMDGTLFVVRSRFSRSRSVIEALELLDQRQVKVLGLVLNRTDATARSYNYYKYKEYHPVVTTV